MLSEQIREPNPRTPVSGESKASVRVKVGIVEHRK